MNLFIFLLLIPLSFAAGVTAPDCRGLATLIQGYEKDLGRSFIQNPQCNSLKTEDIVKTEVPLSEPKFLEGKLCHSLTAVDAELETLKLQEAVLTGIQKLKTTVAESKALVDSKNPKEAREAGRTFLSSLNAAQSLELVLNTNSPGKDRLPLIQRLKEVPEDKRADLKTFKEKITELCKENDIRNTDACNADLFKPSQETVVELNALLKNSKPDEDQVKKWKSMIAIKKKNAKPEDASYSFNEMRKEMESAFATLDKDNPLSKGHLSSIQKLSDFENAPGIPFVDDIHKIKDLKKNKIAQDRFSWLIQDAQKRQQYEIQSKMSLAWLEVMSTSPLNDKEKNDCALAKGDYNKATLCHEHLKEAKEKMNGTDRAYLENFLPTVETSINYEDSLARSSILCLAELKKTGSISEECYGKVHTELGSVQEKILQLNFLKENIAAENPDLVKLRDFALLKWGTQQCDQADASVDFCEDNLTLTKQAFLTVSDAMNISVLFAPKPEAEVKMKEICAREGEKKKSIEGLCAFFNPSKPDDTIVRARELQKQKDDERAPVVLEDTGRRDQETNDRWLGGGLGLFNQVMQGAMANRYFNNFNPYQYSYSPYQFNTTGLSTSDTLLFNARYYGGYSTYMSTPGYQTYTAFGSRTPLSPYTGISNYSSKYFSN